MDTTHSAGSARPYPEHLAEGWRLRDGTPITIRPIRAADVGLVRTFDAELSSETRRARWHSARKLTEAELARLADIDYEREMALIAVARDERGERELGVARYVRDADGASCEFALVVTDAAQRRGLGEKLLRSLLKVAATAGIAVMTGITHSTNAAMVRLARRVGFGVQRDARDATLMALSKALRAQDLRAA